MRLRTRRSPANNWNVQSSEKQNTKRYMGHLYLSIPDLGFAVTDSVPDCVMVLWVCHEERSPAKKQQECSKSV
jgi:hypothetical protein